MGTENELAHGLQSIRYLRYRMPLLAFSMILLQTHAAALPLSPSPG